MMSLICPVCGTVFQLEADDLAGPKNVGGAWSGKTERTPHGKSEMSGPCPFCEQTVTIARPPAAVTKGGG
jgi:C4-type Zn-finger protein